MTERVEYKYMEKSDLDTFQRDWSQYATFSQRSEGGPSSSATPSSTVVMPKATEAPPSAMVNPKATVVPPAAPNKKKATDAGDAGDAGDAVGPSNKKLRSNNQDAQKLALEATKLRTEMQSISAGANTLVTAIKGGSEQWAFANSASFLLDIETRVKELEDAKSKVPGQMLYIDFKNRSFLKQDTATASLKEFLSKIKPACDALQVSGFKWI